MTVTIGVEEEFHLVDPARRVMADDAEQVLAASAALQLDLHAELQRSEVETATGVCTTPPELRDQLVERRRAAVSAASSFGLAVVGAGTVPARVDLSGHPFAEHRYEHLVSEYAEVGRQQLVCAMQTQVGVEDRELAVAALPVVGAW